MMTVEQFKDICDLMVNAIDKKRQLFHIKSNIKVEAIAFPYQPSPVIYLEGDVKITYDELGDFAKDFETSTSALDAFGYQVTRTLLDDENIAAPVWPININGFKESAEKFIDTPLKFAEEFLGSFETSDCLHKQCPECNGTGNKVHGGSCIHSISCPCKDCTPH